MVRRWSYVIASLFIGFPDLKNHILDTKIIFLSCVVWEILYLDPNGRVILTQMVRRWSYVIASMFIGFLDPINHILDTKIIFLSCIVWEMLYLDLNGRVILIQMVRRWSYVIVQSDANETCPLAG